MIPNLIKMKMMEKGNMTLRKEMKLPEKKKKKKNVICSMKIMIQSKNLKMKVRLGKMMLKPQK